MGGRMNDDVSTARNRHERYTLGIVDNDPLVANFLAHGFLSTPLDTLWALTDAEQARIRCETDRSRPRILLTDIEMPSMNGRELFHRLHSHYPEIVVIGISAFPDSIKEAGLVVLPKESRIEEIVHLAGMLLHDDSLTCWFPQCPHVNPLSANELQVLDYYAQGKTTLAICHLMNVAESSVKTFVKRACKKLNVHSRTEAIVMCVRNNWI